LTTLAASPGKPTETDGVAITSFNEVNELDAAADQVQQAPEVQVLAFNEINEIDQMTTPAPPPVPARTIWQAVSSDDQTPMDKSWIGKLLLAVAGTIALAGATRFFVAQAPTPD
jgi:hypothetical protein